MMKIIGKSLLLIMVVVLLAGCSLTSSSENMNRGQKKVEKYAEERYLLGLNYMEQSRFELASQQFAIAAKSAVSRELKVLAIDGYEKANKIIEGRR